MSASSPTLPLYSKRVLPAALSGLSVSRKPHRTRMNIEKPRKANVCRDLTALESRAPEVLRLWLTLLRPTRALHGSGLCTVIQARTIFAVQQSQSTCKPQATTETYDIYIH